MTGTFSAGVRLLIPHGAAHTLTNEGLVVASDTRMRWVEATERLEPLDPGTSSDLAASARASAMLPDVSERSGIPVHVLAERETPRDQLQRLARTGAAAAAELEAIAGVGDQLMQLAAELAAAADQQLKRARRELELYDEETERKLRASGGHVQALRTRIAHLRDAVTVPTEGEPERDAEALDRALTAAKRDDDEVLAVRLDRRERVEARWASAVRAAYDANAQHYRFLAARQPALMELVAGGEAAQRKLESVPPAPVLNGAGAR